MTSPAWRAAPAAASADVSATHQTFIRGSAPIPPDTPGACSRRSIETRSGELVMFTKIRSLALAAVACVSFGPVMADPIEGGLSLRPEAVPWARFQGRLSLATSTSGLLHGDLAAAAEPSPLRGMSLMGDYYLTGSLLGERQSGGLRATSALLIGPRWQTLGAGSLGLPNSGRGLVVERRLPTPTAGRRPQRRAALPRHRLHRAVHSRRLGLQCRSGRCAHLGFHGAFRPRLRRPEPRRRGARHALVADAAARRLVFVLSRKGLLAAHGLRPVFAV